MKTGEGFRKSLAEAAAEIRRARKVQVMSHVHPDGDTIGCLLALGLALLQMGKRVTLLSQDGVPTRFQFLPGSELVLTGTTETADLAIAVDCGSVSQLGSLKRDFDRARRTLQIDHHDFGKTFGTKQLVEAEAAAVGEILYELLRALGTEMTPAIATCLLASIIVDTGAFRFSNIRPKTFEICAQLVKKGSVDLRSLVEASYWKKSRPAAWLSGLCLANACFTPDGSVAWAVVPQKDLKRLGAKPTDADSVADELRAIEGVKAAALLRETVKGGFRVSLRSGSGVNVADVAQRFGGGGHTNAAGCAVKRSEKKKLLEVLREMAG